MRLPQPALASCSCGKIRITIHGTLARLFCHCGICQTVNEASFGDPVFAWRHHLKLENGHHLTWQRYRWTPINLKRGTCKTCGTLMIEHLTGTPVSIVNGKAWQDQSLLPPPRGHIFCESSIRPITDNLPKKYGYLSSELAVTQWVVTGMFER